MLHGRIDEETVVPYQPFVEALRHYVAHARRRRRGAGPSRRARARWSPSSGGVRATRRPASARTRRYRLFEAVAALLGRAAAERPLLLVLEDLHWADMPTLLLLRHVVRRLEGAPLLVLAPARRRGRASSPTRRALLADLSREHVVERIALGGLRREARRRASSLGDRRARPTAWRRRTAGNPFFIEEMLRSLAEAPEAEGVPPRASRTWSRAASRGSSRRPSRR